MPEGETRTLDQVRDHYEIEKELACRLRDAPRESRRRLYASVYDELYRRAPAQPNLIRTRSPEANAAVVREQVNVIRSFLKAESTFLEVGPGSRPVSIEVAKLVKQVYAVDVSGEIIKHLRPPENVRLMLSSGCDIPVPPGSVNVAYSNHLMEHLHPDDALLELRNVYRAVAPGGVYICITPNRLSGPHNISRYFDRTAAGLHLKEYTVSELSRLFGDAGFSDLRLRVGARGRYANVPPLASILCEKLLDALPPAVTRSAAESLPFRPLLRIRLVGRKRGSGPPPAARRGPP